MLLRFIAENIFSFKDAVEFNTFPSSKTQTHPHHKVDCSHATVLRLASLYGANGAGKSNLLAAIDLLHKAVLEGSLDKIGLYDNISFRFDQSLKNQPSGLAIEFFHAEKIFYYHIEFKKGEVVLEELYISKKTRDVEIFRREGNKIHIGEDFMPKGMSDKYVDVLDRFIRPDMLLLSFFGHYYPNEIRVITDAFMWFVDGLRVVLPDTISGHVPHLLDKHAPFRDLVNETIPELKTGISSLEVNKVPVSEETVQGNQAMIDAIREARKSPETPQVVQRVTEAGVEIANIVFEDGQVWQKTLISVREDARGNLYKAPISIESDGTQRLIEYMPLFFAVTKTGGVYVVDEIERSVHPILIKSIMQKISSSETAGGQLIFTTHESGLLDKDIFRPDEIWFAQKDVDQATKLYPLSDFNVHKTANLENGYLAGRYGGVPFLSNLNDLHW